MNISEELEKIKTEVVRLNNESQQARGAYKETIRRLKNEFGLSSLAEAEEKVKELLLQERKERRKFEHELLAFKKKWSL